MENREAVQRIKNIRLKIEEPTDTTLGWLETWIHKEDIEAFRMAIKALEQEPKKGHWIDKFSLIASCSAECSACHERSSGYVYDTGYSLKHMYYDFCPNCGAKMEEVEE